MHGYTCKHFSLSNPSGLDQDNIGKLLNRLAESLSTKGEIEIMDIVFHNDLEDGKDWPQFTVYYVDKVH